jgi:small GTP-binding protein
MSTQYRHVYMSYSRKDEDVMKAITSELRKSGYEIWVDNENLIPGTPIWESEIEKALITSVAVIVLLSPDSKQSQWVRREISYAEEYKKRIYPVLIRGDMNEAIPLKLITRQYVDLRKNREQGLRSLIAALRAPFEVFSKSEKTWENYRADLVKGQRRPVHETKVLIVGQGSVGKTSLIQRLLHNDFDPNQSKTDGISISRWQVKENGNRRKESYQSNDTQIQLNIWDFGGQEIMHTTYQFFLTHRSLYILTLDARLTQEENRVEYWLKIIQSFGGGSPIIIIGNKIDQHPLDIDRTGL